MTENTRDCRGIQNISSAVWRSNATHEIGHWLNLIHIWGDRLDCKGTDDVDDTPTGLAPNYVTPAFPHVSCNNGPNGDMFMNYMDYVDDAAMFTAGQVDRMAATLDGPRVTIGKPAVVSWWNDPVTNPESELTGAWRHTHEEDSGGELFSVQLHSNSPEAAEDPATNFSPAGR